LAGSTNSGYIAARIYGMRSRLLKSDDYEELHASTDIASLITNLRGTTTYKQALEEALLLEDPLTAIDSAINNVLSRRMKRILKFTGGDYHKTFKMMSLRWEVSNVHLAIRSIIGKTEFPLNFIPLGPLDIDELIYIAKVPNLTEALRYLESTLNPLATPVRTIIDEDIPPSDLNAIDGVFNQFYQQLMSNQLEKIEDNQIADIMRNMILEEREFENAKFILNLIGKISRGTLLPSTDFNSVIFPGKARIRAEEVEKATRSKDINSLRRILQRTTYREVFKEVLDIGSSQVLQQNVEEVERLFYANQVRKRFKKPTFNLGLAYFWQMVLEARNLRLITHGVETFTREETSRRMIYA
jgi:vacuolar-type H+-ATPase subunit C/Vma6